MRNSREGHTSSSFAFYFQKFYTLRLISLPLDWERKKKKKKTTYYKKQNHLENNRALENSSLSVRSPLSSKVGFLGVLTGQPESRGDTEAHGIGAGLELIDVHTGQGRGHHSDFSFWSFPRLSASSFCRLLPLSLLPFPLPLPVLLFLLSLPSLHLFILKRKARFIFLCVFSVFQNSYQRRYHFTIVCLWHFSGKSIDYRCWLYFWASCL